MAWASVFAPRDRRTIYDWAAERIELQSPYAITGSFSVARSRHFVEIFNALKDDRTRDVSILKPVRGGGSLVCDIHFVWAMKNDPGPYLNAFQKDPIAESHFEKKLQPLLKCAGLMPEGRFDIKELDLPNGHTCYTSGPSINNLQTRGMRYIRLDEPWLYPQGMMAEAYGRLGDFLKLGISKFICVSQGGPMQGRTVEECEWCRHSQESEQNEWTVRCQHCGKYFEPKIFDQREDGNPAGLVWDNIRLPNNDWDIQSALDTVRFECPLCGGRHDDYSRTVRLWNSDGQYRVVGRANILRRLFHWEAVIDFPWRELAEMWMKASDAFRSGVTEPKQQFRQKYCAQNVDERTIMEGGQRFSTITVETKLSGDKVPGELGRCLSIDRQKEDMFWWSVRAWCDGGKSIRLGFGKAFGFSALEDVRKQYSVESNHVLIDSAYMPKGDSGVYAACCKYGWLAIRGEDSYHFTHHLNGKSVQRSFISARADPEIGKAGEGTRFCILVRFSKPIYNRRVQNQIDSGHWQEPRADENDPMEGEYRRQMGSRFEKVTYRKKDNRLERQWVEGKNDHARDLANAQVLFATLADFLDDALPANEIK